MEGPAAHAPVLSYLAEVSPDSEFMLVDIGCSMGIDEVWRRFGTRLRALAIDPNLAEMDRLQKAETNPSIQYLAGYAGLSPDHPFAGRKATQAHPNRNPWYRLSTAQSLELMRSSALTTSEKTEANLWSEVDLAERSRIVVVPDYLREHGIGSIDFIKIDIDGDDFDVLNSFDTALDALQVMALGLEVNFYGSAVDTDHAFHNTDRFMRAQGFELFNLTVRRYSLAALPSRYVLSVPAQTEFGRPLQGDALYARDLGSPEYQELAARLQPVKLLNLICIFAAFSLPDCAAEIATLFRSRLAPLCDVERVLDLLAEQARGPERASLSYRQYVDRFQAQDPMFFPVASPPDRGRPSRGLRRWVPTELKRAWRALRGS
jgi:FkbM family methyltransferase